MRTTTLALTLALLVLPAATAGPGALSRRYTEDYHGGAPAEIATLPLEQDFACHVLFEFVFAPGEYPGVCFGLPYDMAIEARVVDATRLPVGTALWWVDVEGDVVTARSAGTACGVFAAPFAQGEFLRVLPLDAASSAEACAGRTSVGATVGAIELWF